MTACNALLKNKEGWIFSPNFPSNYDDGRTCEYTVQRYASDVCQVGISKDIREYALEGHNPSAEMGASIIK